ncbi:DUF4809 family protein [Enterococcus gallinarum]|nr:DUF4809 family protein [Enterococcus gallinarum]
MQEAIITSTVEFNQWCSCSACEKRKWKDTVCHISNEWVDIPLDGLTVAHLVSAVVARNGFKQELQMDMLDDEYILLSKRRHSSNL